jgi:hypothetical protein
MGGAGRCHTVRSRSWTRPQRWEARTSKRPHLDGGGLVTATPQCHSRTRHDGGRRAPASVRARTERGSGHRHIERSRDWICSRWWEARTSKRPRLDREGRVPAAATPRGDIPGLARVDGRRALASVHAWMGRGCRSPPHLGEPFLDSLATVGGAHRQAESPIFGVGN